jgi:hypothetical protein
MNDLEEYYKEFLFSLKNRSSANDQYIEEIFFDDCLKVLINGGHSFETEADLDDASAGGYIYSPFKSHGLRIDGYEYIQDRQIINLYVCHFKNENSIQTLTQTEINQFVSNTKKFFEKSLDEDFHQQFEEDQINEAYDVSKFIYDFEGSILEVNIIIITNCLLSKSIKSLKLESDDYYDNRLTRLEVWDIKRFFDDEGSGGKSESIEIEFENPIPTLSATLDSSKYHSYLCVIPGSTLANLYEKYGARILEANVRSFLQFRGNVNKGIRYTLKNDPDMFFAYNNGITVTADKCELNDQGQITSLTNLQIVNGGQTTATLYHASKLKDVSLEGVFVQTKLSILDDQEDDEVIPNISKFANSQNKINESDFFSNHPFHRKMQDKSRRINTEVVAGHVRSTKWFYERSRGQYQTELAKRSPRQKREFQEEFPKSQLITKTDLAKTSVIFSGEPNRAVQGLQIAFKYFAVNIQKDWESNENLFNDLFYKKLISQQIMFNQCRLLAMEKVSGNAIQPVTAYGLFMLNELSNTSIYNLPFIDVWNKQKISLPMENQLVEIIRFVLEFFNNQTEGVEGRSILSYSKTKACVTSFKDKIKQLNSGEYLINQYKQTLRSTTEDDSDNRQANRDEDVANEMDLFIKLSKLDWEQVIIFAKSSNEIYDNDIELLSTFPKFLRGGREVTRKQQLAIHRILMRMKDEGFAL